MRAILAAVLILGGCATVAGGQRLTQAEWHAVDVNGVPVTGPAALTLRLGEGGQASGNSGCNGFSGAYQFLSEQRIAFGALASTRRACDPAIMEQESRYLSILQSAGGYSVYRDGSLSLIAADGRAIRFRQN